MFSSPFKVPAAAELPAADVVGQPVVKVAALAGLLKSQSEARRMADGGGLYLNNERVGAMDPVSEDRVIDGQVLVLRAGKKNQRVVRLAR